MKPPPKLEIFEVAKLLSCIRQYQDYFDKGGTKEQQFWHALIYYNHNTYFNYYYHQFAGRNQSKETLLKVINQMVKEEWVDTVISELYGSTP